MTIELPRYWWGTDLAGYRPAGGTYQGYPIDSLPPVPEELLAGDFAWLPEKPSEDPTEPLEGGALDTLTAAADAVGIQLPEAFTRFMSDARLQSSVPSCTACYWDLAAAPVPSPFEPGAHLIRFLSDQQGCLFWYLYSTADGGHLVVASPADFDEPDILAMDPTELIEATTRCGESFEEFVFRFWIENVLWFELNQSGTDVEDLPPLLRQYLRHYEQVEASQ